MNTLILIPGALGHSLQFNDLVAELETKNISATALDLPGHGLNPYSPEAITVPMMAKAVILKLNALGIHDPVNIFGHSLGGYIGLYLCLHFPDRVNSLFTLGTKWHWTQEISVRETQFLNPEKMEQKIPAYVQHLKSVHRDDWKNILNSIAMLMNDLGQNHYLEPVNLKDIGQPCRIALGDRDNMVTLEETVAVYRSLTHGQLQVNPNTPHPFEKIDYRVLAKDIASVFKYPKSKG